MAEDGKRIIKTRIGEQEIAEDGIISFPQGLIGFEGMREFVLLQVGEESPFLLLQSLEDPGLGFLVADPYPFLEGYEIKLGQAERHVLDLEKDKSPAVLVTVNIPRDDPQKTTLNLSGPIVLNSEARLGLQVPQIDSAFPPRVHLSGDPE